MSHFPPASRSGWEKASAARIAWMMVGGLVVVAASVGALVAATTVHQNAVYAEFLKGCEQDHKHYECMLLWRASNRDDPTLLPIPIPILTR